jgi:hypothetical protein
VDTLIAELAKITDELERHGMHGDVVPARGALAGLAFSHRANDDLGDILMRLRMVRGCLVGEERRRCWRADDDVMTEPIT